MVADGGGALGRWRCLGLAGQRLSFDGLSSSDDDDGRIDGGDDGDRRNDGNGLGDGNRDRWRWRGRRQDDGQLGRGSCCC